MNRADAHQLLDGIRAGYANAPVATITQALRLTGDIPPERGEAIAEPFRWPTTALPSQRRKPEPQPRQVGARSHRRKPELTPIDPFGRVSSVFKVASEA